MRIETRTSSDVGAAIRARRRELGWDQATLADKIGVSRLWVNQIEKGKPGAALGLILNAFTALGLSLTVGASGRSATDEATETEAKDPASKTLHEHVRAGLLENQAAAISEVLKAARRKPSP
jgi:y4mF family transcriptional regulator